MADILQTTFLYALNLICILIQISLKFVLNGPVKNGPAFIEDNHDLFGDKSLYEPMVA